VWSKYINEDEWFWQVNRDDDFYEVAYGIVGGVGDDQLYVEHKDDDMGVVLLNTIVMRLRDLMIMRMKELHDLMMSL
jgi:hypothetical protein